MDAFILNEDIYFMEAMNVVLLGGRWEKWGFTIEKSPRSLQADFLVTIPGKAAAPDYATTFDFTSFVDAMRFLLERAKKYRPGPLIELARISDE